MRAWMLRGVGVGAALCATGCLFLVNEDPSGGGGGASTASGTGGDPAAVSSTGTSTSTGPGGGAPACELLLDLAVFTVSDMGADRMSRRAQSGGLLIADGASVAVLYSGGDDAPVALTGEGRPAWGGVDIALAPQGASVARVPVQGGQTQTSFLGPGGDVVEVVSFPDEDRIFVLSVAGLFDRDGSSGSYAEVGGEVEGGTLLTTAFDTDTLLLGVATGNALRVFEIGSEPGGMELDSLDLGLSQVRDVALHVSGQEAYAFESEALSVARPGASPATVFSAAEARAVAIEGDKLALSYVDTNGSWVAVCCLGEGFAEAAIAAAGPEELCAVSSVDEAPVALGFVGPDDVLGMVPTAGDTEVVHVSW